jgi:hypothetical protein
MFEPLKKLPHYRSVFGQNLRATEASSARFTMARGWTYAVERLLTRAVARLAGFQEIRVSNNHRSLPKNRLFAPLQALLSSFSQGRDGIAARLMSESLPVE